ncbi:hypothetical protein VTI74DRAFT_7964 [Chaetomium olivicolor]
MPSCPFSAAEFVEHIRGLDATIYALASAGVVKHRQCPPLGSLAGSQGKTERQVMVPPRPQHRHWLLLGATFCASMSPASQLEDESSSQTQGLTTPFRTHEFILADRQSKATEVISFAQLNQRFSVRYPAHHHRKSEAPQSSCSSTCQTSGTN